MSEISRLIGKQVQVLCRPAAVSSEQSRQAKDEIPLWTFLCHGKVLDDGVSQKTCRSVLFF